MNNNKFLKVLSVTLILALIGSAFLVIYMKNSNNCALLGTTVQNWIEKRVCQAGNANMPEGAPSVPLTPTPYATPPVANSADVDPYAVSVEQPAANNSIPQVSTDGALNANPENQSNNELPPSNAPIVEPPVDGTTGALSAPSIDNPSNTNTAAAAESKTQLIGASTIEPNGQSIAEPSANINLADASATTASSATTTTATATTDASAAATPVPAYETPALLVAENKLKITSLIQGKVKSLAYKEGQSFNKDDILVIFDCRNIELDLEIQRADLKDKEESLKDLTKLKELKSTSTYSLVRAQSQVEQTRKLIEKYEYQLSTCVIKAEYAGKVISRQVNENQYVQAGQEIMTVNNNSELLVKAYVPVSWLDWLKAGTTFELCFDKNNCHKGVVNRVGAEVDAISQTLDIFGRLTSENTSNLIAGLSGQVKFEKL